MSAQRKRESSGRQGERAVAAMLRASKLAGLGDVKRRPGSARMIGGRLVHTKQGVDFAGHLASGRAIYLEAKRCPGETRLPYSELRPSQREELECAYAGNAAAVVVVLWGPLAARTSVVPWRCIREATLAGTRGSADLAPWEVRGSTLLLAARGVVEA